MVVTNCNVAYMNMIWIHHNILLILATMVTCKIVTNVIMKWVDLDIICTSCKHRIGMDKVSSSEMDSVWTKNIFDWVPIPIYLRWLNQLLFLLNLPTNNPLVFTYMHLLPIDHMLLYMFTYNNYHLQCELWRWKTNINSIWVSDSWVLRGFQGVVHGSLMVHFGL